MNNLKRSTPLFLFFAATLGHASCSPGDVSAGSGPAATAQASGQAGPSSTGQNASAIANAVAEGVGKVTRTSPVRSGAPIIVLEERHNSRVGQIQHAIMLTRLHERHGLNAVVLEGYLKGEPEINTDWFTKSVRAGTPEARASVAVPALARGDISAVEFTKLVYPDVAVHSAEKRDNYFVEPPSSFPVGGYLQKIATVDQPWALDKSAPYRSPEDFQKLSGDEKVKSAREIKERAEKLHVAIDPKDAQAMLEYINFFEKRMASNDTIVSTLSDVLNRDARHTVAANIGADHSAGIASLLDRENRSYAFISPRYVPGNKERGDLSSKMYDRKNKRLPVFASGASQLLFEAASKKKPQPILPEDWGQAYAEFAGMVDSVMHAIPPSASGLPLGGVPPRAPPGSPRGAGGETPSADKPPFGLLDKDYDGKRIKIVISGIEVVRRKDGRSAGILIPVLFKDTGRQLYIGARLRAGQEGVGAQAPTNRTTVEEILAAALREVENEQRPPDRLEDQAGAIDLGLSVSAFIGNDAATVKQLLLAKD